MVLQHGSFQDPFGRLEPNQSRRQRPPGSFHVSLGECVPGCWGWIFKLSHCQQHGYIIILAVPEERSWCISVSWIFAPQLTEKMWCSTYQQQLAGRKNQQHRGALKATKKIPQPTPSPSRLGGGVPVPWNCHSQFQDVFFFFFQLVERPWWLLEMPPSWKFFLGSSQGDVFVNCPAASARLDMVE